MYSLVLAADVDVSASIISICNWVIGLGLALGTAGFVGVGIMFIFAFDDIYQGARARKAMVMIIFGMILLYSAAGIASMVKDHLVYQQPALIPPRVSLSFPFSFGRKIAIEITGRLVFQG